MKYRLAKTVGSIALVSCALVLNAETQKPALSKEEVVEVMAPESSVSYEAPMDGGVGFEITTVQAKGFGQYFTATYRDTGKAGVTGVSWFSKDDNIKACAKDAETRNVCSMSGGYSEALDPSRTDYPANAIAQNTFEFMCSDGVSGTANVLVSKYAGLQGEGIMSDGREFFMTFYDINYIYQKIQCLDFN